MKYVMLLVFGITSLITTGCQGDFPPRQGRSPGQMLEDLIRRQQDKEVKESTSPEACCCFTWDDLASFKAADRPSQVVSRLKEAKDFQIIVRQLQTLPFEELVEAIHEARRIIARPTWERMGFIDPNGTGQTEAGYRAEQMIAEVIADAFAAELGIRLSGPWAPTRAIRFSGYDWLVKNSHGEQVGPGPNRFDDEAVELTPEGLKLKIVRRELFEYYCGEIVSQRSFGYGTYRFTLGSNIDRLAPNVVLGLFTWSDDGEDAHRELDVEISRWGAPSNDNGQFVVQPYGVLGNMVRFPIAPSLASSVHEFTWQQGSAAFRTWGSGAGGLVLVKEHTFTGRIPKAGGENARMNLWLFMGRPPGPGITEVLISKFEFCPPGAR